MLISLACRAPTLAASKFMFPRRKSASRPGWFDKGQPTVCTAGRIGVRYRCRAAPKIAAVIKASPRNSARWPPPRVKCPSCPSRACIITIFKVCFLILRAGMNRPTSYRQRSSSSRREENTALGWLGHDMRGAGVLATARKHLQIRYAVAAVLPARWAPYARWASWKTSACTWWCRVPLMRPRCVSWPRASRGPWPTKAGTLTKSPSRYKRVCPNPAPASRALPQRRNPWAKPPWARSRRCAATCARAVGRRGRQASKAPQRVAEAARLVRRQSRPETKRNQVLGRIDTMVCRWIAP